MKTPVPVPLPGPDDVNLEPPDAEEAALLARGMASGVRGHDRLHRAPTPSLRPCGTVESEVEVFTLIARANDDLHAFSLLAMVVSLFETGYLRTGAGLFESSPGHLSAGRGMAVRLADAMRRGALCTDIANNSDSIDFLRLDWFDLAPLPVDQIRTRFCLQHKSAAAIEAGSVGPWEPGGISPYQLNAGRELAAHQGRRYESFGASLADGTKACETARGDVRDAGRRGG